VDEVVFVDQSPIGRTPRGNPSTYTKVHDRIRKLFAATPEAVAAGLEASAFSFNSGDGRCPECGGAGAEQVEMQFLSDVTLACEACGGKRFRKEVLRVPYRGKTLDEVLGMTIREALGFFGAEVEILERLSFLDGLGLGYLSLGQPLNTLSGGEAQRLKLAGKVLEARRKKLLFLLDEPTTGLHLEDVARLIEVLQDLVDAGHGVVVIEHHLDVIAAADHVIDLGPEGGDAGGRLVARGAPEEIAARAAETGSITGEWLRRHFARRPAESPAPSVEPRGGPAECPPGRAGVIRIVGARENNLKDITVEVPRDRLVVVTGLSGSGKSSLLHDIVFAEGQRRYLDCLSPYARQFIEDLHRPDIDHLEGIPPAVSIEQRTSVGGRKSTVGTVTEVYQFLRLLYSRAGVQTCPDCGDEVVPRRLDDIVERVRGLSSVPGRLLAPAIRGKKGFHSTLLARARRRGVLDARIDGEWVAIPEDREIRLERHRAHDIDLVVGRIGKSPAAEKVRSLVERGLDLGGGVVRWVADSGEEVVLNLERSCPSCARDFDEPDPRDFSFHSRHGACPGCEGYGSSFEIDPEKLIDRWDEPLDGPRGGPLAFLEDAIFPARLRGRTCREARAAFPEHAAKPLSSWPAQALRSFLHGSRAFAGLLPGVEDRLASLDEEDRRDYRHRWGREVPCSTCGGGRLRKESLAVKVGGKGIAELCRLPVGDLRRELSRVRWNGRSREIGAPIAEEIDGRLEFLEKVGLEYLTLDRSAITLSTGEAQRIRLAAQLGSRLRGVCYILDEPTIGLHSRDGASLLETLRGLRDRGNSVLVIEHDEATIEAADHIIDMGPGPGRGGGEVVAQGTLEDVLRSPRSATGAALLRVRERAPEPPPHEPPDRWLEVEGATLHNLKGVDARFPVGALTVVTGVSGAGKSTLVRGVLEESARRSLRGLRPAAAGARAAPGMDRIEAVREVDQLPLGRTPRSTPATYVGFWSRIRRTFASTPEARSRGYGERRFSFNAPGGRCEACQGQGRIRMEMSFLPDVRVDCEECRGRRFNPETLEVLYRGKSIGDVLEMSVEEALRFFEAHGDLVRPLGAMQELGLGYLTLGQASTTLSGGEAQRVKLAVELGKSASGACLYILDEPTTGLHMEDVGRLVAVLRRLARAGHAVVVIEHHLDVVLGADWVIDLGPEGGEGGGRVLFQGSPRDLLRREGPSHTADALRERVGMRPKAAARPSQR
jgi:excinuclease ABC subunit A